MISKEFLVIPGENKISIIDINEYKLIRIIEVPDSSMIFGACMLNFLMILFLLFYIKFKKFNKNMLLTGDQSKVIRQWKIENDNLILLSKNEKIHDKCIYVLLNLGDGHIASGSDDKTIKIL